MDLAQQAKIVDSIHDTLSDYVGQRLRVRANMGRSKIIESEGVLTQVHPRLFIMEMDRKRGRTARQSYQYSSLPPSRLTAACLWTTPGSKFSRSVASENRCPLIPLQFVGIEWNGAFC